MIAAPSLQKALDLLADIDRRLEAIEHEDLTLRAGRPIAGPRRAACAALWPAPPFGLCRPSYGASLSKAASGLPTAFSAEAVLSALLADPATAGSVRAKIEEINGEIR